MASVREMLKRVPDLPSLPGTVAKLINALGSDVASAADIEEILRTDEGMAASVLRTANSARQGQVTGRVFTLQESIARIGQRELRRMVSTLSAKGILVNGGAGYGLERGQLWQSSICGALGAELLAEESGLEDPDVCFIAGLLRDIGKLAMDYILDIDTMEVAFRGEADEPDQLAWEKRVFGIDHAELGAELSLEWGLPERISDAIRHHHSPPGGDAEADALFDLVHCGDALCSLLAVGVGWDGLGYVLSERAAKAIGMNRKAMESYLPELRKRFEATGADVEFAS